MIEIFGRSYDLPRTLMPCSACRRGHLKWNGKRWQCTSDRARLRRPQDDYVDGTCNRGFSLGGLFAEPNVEGQFQTARLNLRRMRLTAEVLGLLRDGVIRIRWATPEYCERQAAAAEMAADRLRFHETRLLMEARPQYRKGGL